MLQYSERFYRRFSSFIWSFLLTPEISLDLERCRKKTQVCSFRNRICVFHSFCVSVISVNIHAPGVNVHEADKKKRERRQPSVLRAEAETKLPALTGDDLRSQSVGFTGIKKLILYIYIYPYIYISTYS